MLELKNIKLSVEGEKGQFDILKNIDLTLQKNKIYVITGPNGEESPLSPKLLWAFINQLLEIYFLKVKI